MMSRSGSGASGGGCKDHGSVDVEGVSAGGSLRSAGWTREDCLLAIEEENGIR